MPQQAETFIGDFNQTAILSIIKISARHFLEQNADIPSLLEQYGRIDEFSQPELNFKRYFKELCHKIDMRSSAVGNLLGSGEIRNAYAFSKALCNSI